jgi:hypothetical protein
MEAKHTKGPWTLHDDETPWTCGDARTAIELGEELGHTEILFSLQNDEQEPLAYLPWEPLANDKRCEELRANARLIAAAPELLEALTRVRTWLMAPNTSDESLDEMTFIVKSAIAKALSE